MWHLVADRQDSVQWQLNHAAIRGDVKEMEKLIAAGADCTAQPTSNNGAVHGFTPLFDASGAAQPDAVEFLISAGADVNSLEATETPLDMARHRLSQATKTVEILVEAGAMGLNERNNQTKKPNKSEQATPRKPSD